MSAPPPAPVTVTVNGRLVTVAADASLVEALLALGPATGGGVGCFGQGVCGSCRAMVRRPDEGEVRLVLACETLVEPGLTAIFLEDPGPVRPHPYDLADQPDVWRAPASLRAVFPEAVDCRHCGGCDVACPKGIAVEDAVRRAVDGQLQSAAAAFDDCVMCDLCTLACPESIAPNHLGLFARRLLVAAGLRPDDLVLRLHQIESGAMTVDWRRPVPGDPAHDLR
jgi:ferredoxin